jgi:uncharacterized membrane protein
MDRLSKAFLALAIIGIADALYHAYGEITAYSTPLGNYCTINNVWSCSKVFLSGYTKFPPGSGGISLWVYGVVWFPPMLVLGYWFVRKYGSLRGEIMVPILMVGNIFTLYLWYLELAVIGALCPVCISLYTLNYLMTAVCIAAVLREN